MGGGTHAGKVSAQQSTTRSQEIYLLILVYLFSRGCYWYGDGSMYDGQWLAGKMHGKGIFIYPSGNRCE